MLTASMLLPFMIHPAALHAAVMTKAAGPTGRKRCQICKKASVSTQPVQKRARKVKKFCSFWYVRQGKSKPIPVNRKKSVRMAMVERIKFRFP